jgi:hypothetical protein
VSRARRPLLLPAPRELELSGPGPGAPCPAREEPDPSLPSEGFEILASADGVRLRCADAAGLRHGRRTLAQLERQHPEGLPGLHLRDWPDFPVRGFLLDVSRDRVPTRATLARLVELLACLRLNHLELYTEHTFAYREHREVWREASPLTPEDVRWLDALCREHGIELAANQNCFGHMERWLRHPAYAHLAECPGGFPGPAGRRPPGTLHPGPESLALVRSLLRELLPCFSSRRVNVNCDETFELGRGRSAAAARERGVGRVYLEFLLAVIGEVHACGREALFWGDILRRHPELLPELPRRDTVALAWHYEAPLDAAGLPAEVREALAAFGVEPEALRGFAPHVEAYAAHGFPFWVCPGTSSWNSLVGRWPNARANLLDAAEVGRANGAAGFLVTDWGDHGHLQPSSVSWPGLAWGAALAWCAEANRDLDLAAALDAHVFEDGVGGLGAALLELGSLDLLTGLRLPNATPFHAALLAGAPRAFGRLDPAGLAAAIERFAELETRLALAAPRCPDGALVRRELAQALRLARHGAWRLARAAGLPRPDDAALRRDLAEAVAEQRACWLERSRPGGLADSVGRLERVLAEYGAESDLGSRP